MFDSHCHLNIKPLYQNYQSHIAAAKDVDVNSIVVPGINLETSKTSVRMVAEFANVCSAIGIHPTEDLSKLTPDKTMYLLEEMVTDDVVAIGEVGLDYYRYKSSPDVQRTWLSEQISLANKLDLAVILHNRHAGDDLLKVLVDSWSDTMAWRVVFHCCEADRQILKFAIERKIYVGVCGDVTYDIDKQDFVRSIPLDLMVIETDSPYLTPEPVRRKVRFPNKPENLVHTAKKISELLNIDRDQFIRRTTDNARRLFGLS